MAEVDGPKFGARSTQRRRGASTNAPNTENPRTHESTRPPLTPHPHSEPVPSIRHDTSRLSPGDLGLPRTRSIKKRKKSDASLAPEMQLNSPTGAQPGSERHLTDENAASESPCPPRPKARRSIVPSESGSTKSGQDSTAPARTPGPRICPAGFPKSDNDGENESRSRKPSKDEARDSEDDGSSAVFDASSLRPKDVIFERSNPHPPFTRRVIASKVFTAMQKGALEDDKSSKRGKDGCIYVLELSGQRGFVNIGRTTKDPEDRKTQIQRCQMVQLNLVEDQHFTVVSCHERLENIIHADFANERHYFYCPCRDPNKAWKASSHGDDKFTQHGEWFKMDKTEAMERVEQWREWMRKEPYDFKGKLKSEWRKRINASVKDKAFSDTLRKEDEGRVWWQKFMKDSPNPSWIRRVTIEPRLDNDGTEVLSRFWNICEKKQDVLSFLVIYVVLSYFLLDVLAQWFPSMLFRHCSYLVLASTSFCWL